MPGTEAAFDQHASDYDSVFTHSETGKRQRRRVHRYLSRYIDPSVLPQVLELNCGTGEDAVWLAARGHQVTATDLSAQMLEKARKKAETAGLVIRFEKAAFEEISGKFETGSFDFIFSDFGGLNCTDRQGLEKLARDCHRLLKPGGRFIAVIMGDQCSWEKFYFRLKGDQKKMHRRKEKNGTETKIGDAVFTTWYYAPEEIRMIFSPGFRFIRNIPVGWAIPPSYLEPRFKNRKLLLGFLSAIESLFSPFSFTSCRADHFLADFEKLPGEESNFAADK